MAGAGNIISIFVLHFDSLLFSSPTQLFFIKMLPQCDIKLECFDGTLLAHSLIISLASPLLGDLIEVERIEQADKDGMHDGMVRAQTIHDSRINTK